MSNIVRFGFCSFFLLITTLSAHADNSPLMGNWVNDQGDIYQVLPFVPGQVKIPENPDDFIWISRAGTGGKNVDPETGVQMEAIDQGNGTAIVTTTYPDGHQIIRTRPASKRHKVSKKAWELAQVQKQLAELQHKRFHTWLNVETGESFQNTNYVEMMDPFVYQGLNYDTAETAAKVVALNQRIVILTAKPEPKLVETLDPIHFNRISEEKNVVPVILRIEQKDPPHQYDFVEARIIKGATLQARRTMMDIREIVGLPPMVASELVKKWAPPEWVTLDYTLNPNTKQPELRGSIWRLHVTFKSDGHYTIENLHTPFAKALLLKRPHPPQKTIGIINVVDQIELSEDNQIRMYYKTQLQTPASEIRLE